MTEPVTIALDAMSGDHGHPVVVPAARVALERHPELRIILVGDRATLEVATRKAGLTLGERVSIQHATQVVEMDEPPSRALRGKKDSSMRVAIELVKEGRAAAAVSAGNTGALMATARFVLKTLPGIDRPAIISAMPSANGHTHILDLGANTECTPEHLFQFAVMGSVLANAVHGIERPKVALLNIGEEEIKGNDQIREAARLLSASKLNYIGFVEGNDIYLGDVDVVVCDGFVGNVALKTSEGLAKLIGQFLKEEFSRNLLTKLSAVSAMPVLKAFKDRVDPRHYNGASFLGLNGIVIKSHGSADAVSFASAIRVALIEVEKSVPSRIGHLLADLLAEQQPESAQAIQAI
jgi:glycerol-3-phosphate acyltransferase PlsX